MKWCSATLIDPKLQQISPFFDQTQSPFPHQVMAIGNFVGYLAFDLSLSPQTIHVYKFGVISWFKSTFLDVSFFKHPVINQLSSSLEIQWRASHEVAETRRLPYTLDMLYVLKTRVCVMTSPMDHALYVASLIGLVLLTRKCEIIPTAEDHYMREDDVSFRIRSKVPDAKAFLCRSSEAHLYDVTDLIGVVPFIRSAKNDQNGNGHRYYFPVMQTNTNNTAFCFASEMFKWAQRARLLPGDPFLTYRGTGRLPPRWLDYKSLLKALKSSALYCGFDPKRFGSHSLRIGGATILAAAGHPNHYIQKMGRWKSLTFLQYINLACKSMEIALGSISNPSIFTNDQLRILNPI
jgi:hypothetical protein